ncbi:MAG: nitrate ABC transporter substrate-binding protein [Desulfobacterales bacterium]|nr:MAG: nitrate ABC transporter substrate-binding protein [Desulfobacterales bacterium]
MKNLQKRLVATISVFFLFTCFSAGLVAAEGTVKYRLKWLKNVSVAGALYAESHQLFARAGLDVEVKAGGPERDAIREIELGKADFGTASADQVLRARAKGSPVVVIAQLFQVNPLQWMYRPEDTTINSLADLKGKTIGVTFGGNDETIMRTLLARADLAESDVQLFSVRYDYTPFYRRQVALWPVYRNAQGPIIKKQLAAEGEQAVFFNPADFGVSFVANSVVTHERTLRENPQLVERFLSSLLSGWEEAMNPENEAETLRILGQFDPDTAADVQKEQLQITRRLVKPQADMAIGRIDRKSWTQTLEIMQAQQLLPTDLDLGPVLPALDLVTGEQ